MPKEKNESTAIPRAALYVRVSGQEQAIKGLSLDAQQEDLEEYARSHGWIIAGIYIDAAKTARKRLYKRTNFLRMLEDVKQDKIDLILFTRLDRWFRSVADYYKVMEILEAHNCDWKTTQEQYDTSTAGGRMYVNLRLSIAQNEADLCSERIGAVFDSKIKHGTVCSGKCPYGYRVGDDKRLEIVPEQAAVILDAFEHYRDTSSQRATAKYIRETYGVNWCSASFLRMLQNKLYTGRYERGERSNPDFCPSIVPQELFDTVQQLLQRNVKSAPSGRVYLFTGLLICAECGHRLTSCHNRMNYYRCGNHTSRGRCTHNNVVREDVIEQWLFDHLETELAEYRLKWEASASRSKRGAPVTDCAVIRRKLARLKDLYVNEIIDLDDYRRDYDLYTSQLEAQTAQEPEPRPNFEEIEQLLSSGFRSTYDSLPPEGRRSLWRRVIKQIHVNNDREIVGLVFA